MEHELHGDDIERLKALLDGIAASEGDDPHLRLLTALGPFLDSARRERLGAACELVKFLKGERRNAGI